MAEVKDKLVTVESIGELQKYNESRVIDIAHGGTGATTAEEARKNLGINVTDYQIKREIEGQQAFVESNIEKMLVDFVPYVSITAKDASGNSTGASIQVSDHTNEDIGEAGLIQMKTRDMEIATETISINEHDNYSNVDIFANINLKGLTYDGTTLACGHLNIDGDVNIGSDLSGNLNVKKGLSVGGAVKLDDALNLFDNGIYVCDSTNITTNSHAFGLKNGALKVGIDGVNTNINGDNVNITANNKIVPNVPMFTYAATFSVPEDLKLATDAKALEWNLFAYTNSKYFECVKTPYVGVKCKRDGAILISSTILVQDTTKGCQYYCCFFKNGDAVVGQSRESLPIDNAMATLNMSPSVLSVKEGDIITVKVNNMNAATGTVIKSAASRMNIMYLS